MLQSIGQRLSGPRAPKRTDYEGDAGFTLTEVIWALFLLGLVAMAALGLFLSGMTNVSDMQRQQAAASLAATALDQARAVTGAAVNTHGTSGLIKGRHQTAVLNSWDELTGYDSALTADMTLGGSGHPIEVWDVAPGMTEDDQWVPLQTTHTVDNQDYTVDTLVGLCYRLKTAPNMGQACTPARTSVDDDVMYRVRVVVRWDTGSGEDNVYTVSTLIDPSEDPVWNTALLPYPYDDEITVVAGDGESFHHILANDTFEELHTTLSPIIDNTAPALGSYTRGTGDNREGIFYTPPSDVSGTSTFTYHLRDLAGQESLEPATVIIHVLPGPVNDALNVEPGTLTELNDLLLDNDIGVPNISPDRETTIQPFIDDSVTYFFEDEPTPEMIAARDADIAELNSRGVTLGADGTVYFQAPANDGESMTFSYYLVDSPVGDEGAVYPNTTTPATVTITTASVPLEVRDGDFLLDVTSSQTWNDLDWRALTGNSDEVQIRITGVNGGSDSHIRVDGDTGVGSQGHDLEFRTTNNNIGIYEIDYVVVSPGGNESDTGTLTVTVAPTAGDAAHTVNRGNSLDINLASLGIPATGLRIAGDPFGLPGSCGSVSKTSESHVRYQAPTNSSWSVRTCTFHFKLETDSPPHIESHSHATITITVPRF